MPSRAEVRIRIEQLLRVVVVIALIALLWRTLESTDSRQPRDVRSAHVASATLAEWTRAPGKPGTVFLELDSVPTILDRAWLRSLGGAGSTIAWSGRPTPLMIDVQPVASPAGGNRISIAANTARVVVSDEIGVIDSVQSSNVGAAIATGSTMSRVVAHAHGSIASARLADSLILRRVLVVGSAGWESKFATAALEEEGWKVDAVLHVAPGVDVVAPAQSVIDTSHYSAVVALDSAAATYASRIVAFVREGGGVVLGPGAAALDGFAALRAGNVDRAVQAPSTAPNASLTLSSLPVYPISSLRDDAIPLARTRGVLSLVARRFNQGRVLQTGIVDSWRVRMNGGDDGIRTHREWWTSAVSNVAYAPRVSRATTNISGVGADDPAPAADLVATLGPPRQESAKDGAGGARTNLTPWLFLLLVLALLAEISSRRLRGAP